MQIKKTKFDLSTAAYPAAGYLAIRLRFLPNIRDPVLGSILLVVYGIQTLWTSYSKHRQTIIFFIVLMLTTNCLRTIIRNRDWRSRESLLRAGLAALPHNAKMHYNYANFLRDSAMPELAKSHYHKALNLGPLPVQRNATQSPEHKKTNPEYYLGEFNVRRNQREGSVLQEQKISKVRIFRS
ncbi:unnamed protein product [Brassicogethes aeneus]|uniref:Uncharacterized protein n=1 Tax=Brassicogethes aeneus TaxID=1431903 RepID=A0A9P0FEG9_BRAAE|nr:unnamed protein product [Brassicogethes aeneus]